MKKVSTEMAGSNQLNTAEKVRRYNEAFLVRVEYQENATWQGTVTWTNRGKTMHFRSVLEMIKLIDSALEEKGKGEEA